MGLLPIKPFGHDVPPTEFRSVGDVSVWARNLFDMLRGLRQGKFNNAFAARFDQDGTTTVIVNQMLTRQSLVILDPLNASARDLYDAGIYCDVSNRSDGTWTFTHANKPHNDMDFHALVFN